MTKQLAEKIAAEILAPFVASGACSDSHVEQASELIWKMFEIERLERETAALTKGKL